MRLKAALFIRVKPYINMKPNYQVFLKNPQQKTNDEKLSINEIGNVISRRLKEVSELQNNNSDIFVTFFIGKDSIPDSFVDLGNGIYLKDSTEIRSLGWSAFMPTVKAGLSKLTISDSVGKIAIVLSLTKVDESDVFALNAEEDKSRVVYVAQEPECTLDDIIMNDDEKHSLLRALTIITHRDLIFNKWGFRKIDRNTKSVLCFHGAAGTGKTMCAHAVADYLGKKILIGTYSKIQSKFVGEGEKNLVAYFKAAEEQDAVLFIDEADTFLSRRLPSSNENSKHYNSMSNELFQLIEHFNGCIVFASNHIKDFDPAVISRIIEPIEFKLPDKATRIKIIKKLLPPYAPISLTEEDFGRLANMTDGFSGRDIRKAMLSFVAGSVYSHCVESNENPDDVILSFSDIENAFRSVKKNKDNLDKGVSGFSIASRVSEETKKNTRLIQIAAHTLWVDGIIQQNEKKLFDELCSQLGTSIDINDKSTLPSVNVICSHVITKQEKVQMLDIACRMAASDCEYPDIEKNFIKELATILGYSEESLTLLDEYIGRLIVENNQWSSITSHIHSSENDILSKLYKEYSEASAWNKLGIAYLNGSQIEGVNLPTNLERAKFCFERAKSLGYTLSETNERILSD